MGTWCNRGSYIMEDFRIRQITPYERLALQRFLNNYIFPGMPFASAYKQCGNSVVVLIIRMVAENTKILFD